MAEASTPPSTPPRVKFTLWRMLIAISLVGLLLAYPAWIVRRTSRDRVIEREIAGPNVSIVHDYLGPRWLRSILGEDRCRTIGFVRCSGGAVPPNLHRLQQLANLRYLDIQYCDLQDADVERMGVLSQVRHLTLADTCITPRSLMTIRQYPELTRLNVWNTPNYGQELEPLRDAPNLEVVRGNFTAEEIEQSKGAHATFPWELEGLSDPVSLPPLSPKPKLTAPALAHEQVTAMLAKRLQPPMPGKPFYITVSQPYFDDGHLAVLSELPPLTGLSITSNHNPSFTGEGLKVLELQTELKKLSLTGRATVEQIEALSRCASIEDLKLHFPADDIGVAGFQHLAKLPALKRLELQCFRLRDEHLLALSGCKQIEHLELIDADICTSHGLEVIQHFPALTHLYISGTKVSNRLLPHLLSRTKLAELRLANTLVDHQSQAALGSLPSLQKLWIGGFPFKAEPAIVRAIQRKLPACEIKAF